MHLYYTLELSQWHAGRGNLCAFQAGLDWGGGGGGGGGGGVTYLPNPENQFENGAEFLYFKGKGLIISSEMP